MRRKIYLFASVLFCLVLTAKLSAQISYALQESFEAGISNLWTQEHVSGNMEWFAETGGYNPTGCVDGLQRAVFRNETTQTTGDVTKLVSPVMDLTGVYQPILIFSHAQEHNTGDVDELRVYYRTSAEGKWVLLKEYTDRIRLWVTDTIRLVGVNSTYQIAFEGTDKYGKGIVLDNVMVRPMPTCDIPSNITVNNLTTNTATLTWTGSFDADSFLVVLSNQQITDLNTIDISTIAQIHAVEDFSVSLADLLQDTQYYCYIRSYCASEISEWSSTSFTTRNFISLPYTQSFNMAYASNTVNHVSYWSYGTSILKSDGVSMEYMPFVNQFISESSWGNYSIDTTTCLVFTGARNISSAIPAGQYVYTATPEVNITNIQDVQVSFWGTCNTYIGEDYAQGLIVGVMTDPTDFTTFVPVDTVYIEQEKEFNEFIVTFDSYVGNGKYIAFASDFKDKANIFYLDKVTIDVATPALKPGNVKAYNFQNHSFYVTADLKGADSWNILVSDQFVNNGIPANVLYTQNGITDSSVKIDATAFSGQFVQIYAQAVKNGASSEWSLPKKVLVPKYLTNSLYPCVIDFESSETSWTVKELNNYIRLTSTLAYPFTVITQLMGDGSWPYVYDTEPKQGKNSISLCKRKEIYNAGYEYMNKYQVYGDYIALPEVDTLQNIQLQFYLKQYSTYEGNSRVAVGVMTDPYDVTTFDTVAVFDGTSVYKSCVVSFLDYQGTGTFVAIRAIPASVEKATSSGSSSAGYSYKGYYESSNRIDFITLSKLSDCNIPASVKVDPSYNTAEVIWKDNGMEQWKVVVSTTAELTDTIASVVVDTTAYTIVGLNPHTTYYCQVAAVCNNTLVADEVISFRSDCAPTETLPYVENFESYIGGSTSKEIPNCWTMPLTTYTNSYSTSYSPYIYSYEGTAHDGKKSLMLGSSMLSASYYFALPVMADSVKKLQLSLWARGATVAYNDTLLVGVMANPDNIETFQVMDTLFIKGNVYKEYIFDFSDYVGDGQYITVYKNKNDQRYFYIDDIVVDIISDCEKVQEVTMSNITSTGATISWSKTAATQWEVLVTSTSISPDTLNLVADSLILDQVVTTNNPYVFTSAKAEVNTNYYVYVRALCSEVSKGDWSNESTFKTTCLPENVSDYGVEMFSNENALGCWTVGVREGTSNAPSRAGSAAGKFGFYLYMFNTNTSDGAYAIMPPIDIDSISRLQVSFDACTYSTSATNVKRVTVGVISNPSDLSTFTALKTVPVEYASDSTGMLRYTVRFDEYMGDYNEDFGKQVMFLSESGDSANYVYFDNISFDTISTCLEPLEVKVDSVGTYGAHIVWESTADNYQVKISSTAIDPVTTAADVLDTLVTVNALDVNGLQMLKTYYVYVRTICGAGDTSVWSNQRLFTTECPASYALPYSENFESYASGGSAGNYSHPSCWTSYYNAKEGNDAQYPSIATTAYNSTRSLYVYEYASSSVDRPSYTALPKIDADLSKAMISFYYCANTTSASYLPRKMILGIAESVETLDALLSTVTVIDTIEASSVTFQYYTKSLDSYTGQGKYIVLYGCKQTANNGGVYIDDLSIELIPTCFRPNELTTTFITAHQMNVTWTPQGGENKWDVACCLKDSSINSATILTVDTVVATITGLQSATDYDLYVRANCGDGDVSLWYGPLSVTTACLVDAEAANWNFDNKDNTHLTYMGAIATYIIDNCWLSGATGGGTTTNIPYNVANTTNNDYVHGYSSKYSYSGEYALKLYSTAGKNAYAVMPELLVNLDTMQLRFKARSAYYSGTTTAKYNLTYATNTGSTKYPHAVKVGTVTNPYDISTFEPLTEYVLQDIIAADTATLLAAYTEPYPDAFWEDVVVPLYGAKGKYITFLSDYDVTNTIYIDDVAVEKETGCANPSKLAVNKETLTYNHADITWGSSKSKWNIKLTSDVDTVEAVMNMRALSIDTLKAQTNYTFAVQAVCGDSETSEWVSMNFTTPCVPTAALDATWNFEDNLYQYGSSSSYMIPQCWAVGNTQNTTQSNNPYAIANTAACAYSRGDILKTTLDAEKALRFYTTTSSYNAYAIMPKMAFDLDSMALHFYGRAAYFYVDDHATVSNRGRLYASNAQYLKELVIGTLTDPTDMSTLEVLDTITYSQSWSSTTGIYNTADPNKYWEEFTIPLKGATNKYIVLIAPQPAATSYFFVDDLEIVPVSFCTGVQNLLASEVTSNSAKLTWDVVGDPDVVLQIATDGSYESLVYSDTLTTTEYVQTNLNEATNYYYRAKHICTENETDFTAAGSFKTNYAIRFAENFSEVRTYPEDWTRYNATAANAFSVGLGTPINETATLAWKRSPNSIGLPAGHMVVNIYGASAKYWLVTPSIDLLSNIGDSLMLSFDLALTEGESHTAGSAQLNGNDDRFMVVISDDNGTTWKEENAIIWDNTGTGNYVYNEITSVYGGQKVFLDMSKYAGKIIKVAFFGESTVSNADNDLHLDNVQLNRYVTNIYTRTICEWEDYEDETFTKLMNELSVGTQNLVDFSRATKDNESDKLTKLTLTVLPAVTNDISASICTGSAYMENNFTALNAGVYKQKLTSAGGCDSIVSLTLSLIPISRTEVYDTICQGISYTFNGVAYNRTGIYADTLISELTGCDSISTLYLKVNDAFRSEVNTVLCYGETYDFNGQKLSVSNTYFDTIQTSIGCDSIITLNLIAMPEIHTDVYGAVCPGETYTGNGFESIPSVARDYTMHLTSGQGCDSTVVLHLSVLDADTTYRYDTITVADLPYTAYGITYSDKTEIGAYVDTISVSSTGECQAILIYHLYVKPATGIITTKASQLAIMPTIVGVGETVRVIADENMLDKDPVIEVFDAVGRTIYRNEPGTLPMEVCSFEVSGTYLIRVITSDKNIYMGKVIVR